MIAAEKFAGCSALHCLGGDLELSNVKSLCSSIEYRGQSKIRAECSD
jgi:hypothetical protein